MIDQPDIANYADDITPYVSGKNIDRVVKSLQASHLIFKWFNDNQFQQNASKCYVLLSTGQQIHVNIGTTQIKNSQCEKLSVVAINARLSFKTHIQQICGKAKVKLKAFARSTPFMNTEKKKILINTFFNAKRCSCPNMVVQ